MAEPTILLLGCGYTLKKLSNKLDPGSFISTRRVRDADSIEFDITKNAPDFLKDFPSLRVLVDSIPPGEGEIAAYSSFGEALRRSSIEKIIYLSTTGITGIDDGSFVDESTTTTTPKNEQGKRRVRVEEFYREIGKHFCALRLPAIYGPGRGIGNALKEGRYRLIRDSERWTNRIQVDDLITIIQKAIETTSLPPMLYVSDDTPALQREVVSFYCEKFGLPWPNEISLSEAKSSSHHSFLSNQRIQNNKMKEILSLTLKYPSFRDGAETEFEKT